MFFPVGDTPNPHFAAWVTWLLIAVNVAVFLLVSVPLMNAAADPSDPFFGEFLRVMHEQGVPQQQLRQVTAYDLFVFRYGFRPAEWAPLTYLTSLFLHAGWPHLLGNMLFLWIFGNNVEYRLRSIGFLLVYLGTGVVATMFFAIFVPGSQVPMLGASGAISGILGCYFLWFPRNKVRVFILLFPFFMDFVLIPARLVLGLYLVVDNLLPFLIRTGAAGGVAHGAHIGGFVAGVAMALVMKIGNWGREGQ